MTQGQKTVLLLILGIAAFELSLTKRLGQLWALAFTPGASSVNPPGTGLAQVGQAGQQLANSSPPSGGGTGKGPLAQ